MGRNNAFDPRTQDDTKNPRILNREVYYTGDTILRQGDMGYRAYYIEEGAVDVIINEGPHELCVAMLQPGDIFGEMALIDDHPRSATVRAREVTTLSVISRHEIEDKINGLKDKAIQALLYTLAERLRLSTHGQMHQYKNLSDFQDRIFGIVDRVDVGISEDQRASFRRDVMPLLKDLQGVLDRYQS